MYNNVVFIFANSIGWARVGDSSALESSLGDWEANSQENISTRENNFSWITHRHLMTVKMFFFLMYTTSLKRRNKLLKLHKDESLEPPHVSFGSCPMSKKIIICDDKSPLLSNILRFAFSLRSSLPFVCLLVLFVHQFVWLSWDYSIRVSQSD